MAYTPTTWVTGDTVTATKMNKLEQGVANAGGGKYDAYDYVIKQVDSGTPTLEKGTWQGVYDALQDMEQIAGLFVLNNTPDQYHDTVSLFIPLSYLYYYPSNGHMYCSALALDYGGNFKKVLIEWSSDGTISVSFNNI